jgi:shikimate kinase
MSALLAEHPTIAVSGTASNQGRFYDRFEHVVYLYVPLDTLLDRVRARTNNPYGQTAEDQADITRYVAEVEPLIRRSATLELDGLLPIPALADLVEQCLRTVPRHR